MTTSVAPKSDRLYLLDGMRGLAAFAVIVDHVPSEALRGMIGGRHLAVDFFFVLSGLVLARSYGALLTDARAIGRFLKLRLIRFYPMYLLGLGIGIAAALRGVLLGDSAFDAAFHVPSILTGILFLPSPATIGAEYDNLFPYDGPAWSLFFELIANTVWALLAVRLRGRALLAVTVGLALWAGILVYHASVPGAGWVWHDFDVGLARVFFSFLTGVGLYQMMHHSRLPRIPSLVPLVLFIFVLTCPAGEGTRPVFDVLAILVIIPLTVFLAAHTDISGEIAKVSAWFGTVSYGVYILHQPIYANLQYKLWQFGLNGTQQVLIMAALAALVTQLAITFYEVPLRRWLVSRFVPAGLKAPACPP